MSVRVANRRTSAIAQEGRREMIERRQYFALAQQRPGLFVNPPGEIIQILLDEADIRAAEDTVAERLAKRNLPTDWAQVGIVYQDQYLMLLRDAVRFPDGSLGTYIRAIPPIGGAPGVVVLPVYQGSVILIRHFRHGSRAWYWEIPRGFGEMGSTAEENARRELEEEIQAKTTRVIALGQVNLDTDSSGSADELFYAEVESYGQPETTEGIATLRVVRMSEFEHMIRTGEIMEGYTLAAYARAKAFGLIQSPATPALG